MERDIRQSMLKRPPINQDESPFLLASGKKELILLGMLSYKNGLGWDAEQVFVKEIFFCEINEQPVLQNFP